VIVLFLIRIKRPGMAYRPGAERITYCVFFPASMEATLITAQTLLGFAVLPLWMMVLVGG